MTELQERATAAPARPAFDLADRIRKAMRHADLDYRELAERIEVSKSSIGNWVNGVTTPRRRDLRLLAEACNVDLAWLMYGDAADQVDANCEVWDIPPAVSTPRPPDVGWFSGEAPTTREIATNLTKRISHMAVIRPRTGE